MARTSIDRDSVEYVKIPVTSPPSVSLGTQTVEVAITDPVNRPEEADWNSAEWHDDKTVRFLIGPGAFPLAEGTHRVWLRLTDEPEVPVLIAGSITVT